MEDRNQETKLRGLTGYPQLYQLLFFFILMRNSIWLKSNNGSMYNIEFYEKDSLGGVSVDSLDVKKKR